MKKKKAQQTKREWFIVMNSQLEYFSGMMYGGELVWCNDYNEAKPLDNERKFQTLKSLCYGEELVLDYIN
jgi:hypothetical protein